MAMLDGRTILITGASSGLGAHWTRLAVREGARVVAAAWRRWVRSTGRSPPTCAA